MRGTMTMLLGKRFRCEGCGTEILCIKAGEGEVKCCGAPVSLVKPKVLPSNRSQPEP